ncbi:MAG: ATP-binding protein [Vicinamibacteria bacterium]|nr:ATP-binding protein [Vicinamibacteria bacterium]
MPPLYSIGVAFARLRDRLAVKLTLTVVGVAALILLALNVAEMRTHRRFLEEAAVRGADLFGETIRASTHRHMLAGRKSDAYEMLLDIGRQPGIEKVRLFNKEGRVRFSSDQAEIGRLVDKQAEACYLCHQKGQALVRPEVSSRWRVFRNDGHRVVGMVTAIYNEPSCWNAACHAHPAEQRVLGVVDVGMSLEGADRDMAEVARHTRTFAVVALLCLASIVALSVGRLVGRPVGQLAAATHRVAEGDLSGRIPVASHDELGQLAADFNHMADALRQARGELEQVLAGLERQVEERTTALRAAESQVAHAEKMASLGRLSASIAHEINNPLAGVLTFAKLLLRDLAERPLDEALREQAVKQLRLVQRETERCTVIVRNLLEFSRQRPLAMRPASLVGIVEEALSLVAHQVQLRGLTLERDLQDVPAVEADSGQIRQAVVNLVMNACDATPEGGRIRVATRTSAGGPVLLEVSDSGSGVAPEALPRLFDPFFSTKEKGTGLGLSVVYGIVERHGGKIEVESPSSLGAEPPSGPTLGSAQLRNPIGVGATFRISLRRAAAVS